MFAIVEGNIGSGKSTFLDFLQLGTLGKIKVVKEPVEKWSNYAGFNLLEAFYKNPAEYALKLQIVVTLTFLDLLQSCNDPNIVYVFERGFFR